MTERREPYAKTLVKKGEPYRLSYSVLIHDLPADKPLNQNAAYEAMLRCFLCVSAPSAFRILRP